jgi:hypothetical protein
MQTLTPVLYDCLANLEKGTRWFDTRYNNDKQEIANYRQLVQMRLSNEGETGPGGCVAVFSITPEGREALANGRPT